MKRLLSIALLAAGFAVAFGFTAYDCDDNQVSIKTVDLREVQHCKDPDSAYYNATDEGMTVIQIDGKTKIQAYRCSIRFTKTIGYCGWFDSIQYSKQDVIYEKLKPLTKQKCQEIVQTGSYSLEDGRQHDIVIGHPQSFSYFSYGYSNPVTGKCQRATFISEGVQYTANFEEVKVKAIVEAISGYKSETSGKINFPTLGIDVEAKEEAVTEKTHGTIYWTDRDADCEEQSSTIFNGHAALHRSRDEPNNRTWTSAIAMVGFLPNVSNDHQQYGGFVLGKKLSHCDRLCYSTQIDTVMICPNGKGDAVLPSFKSLHPQQHVNNLAHISQLHLSTNLHISRSFNTIALRVCEVHREVQKTRLRLIAGRNPYAAMDAFGKGTRTNVVGAVAHVTKCVEVEVVVAPSQVNCTQDLAVTVLTPGYSNRTRFMNGITDILQDFPSERPCDPVYPPIFKVGSAWAMTNPKINPYHAPIQLSPVSLDIDKHDFTQSLGKNIYTKSQMEDHMRAVHQEQNREASQMKASDEMTRNGLIGGYLGPPISRETFEDWENGAIWKLFPTLKLTGDAGFVFFGVLFILAMIRFLCEGILKIHIHRKKRGCGVWILGAFFGNIFDTLMLPFYVSKRVIKDLHKESSVVYVYKNLLEEERRLDAAMNVDLEAGNAETSVHPRVDGNNYETPLSVFTVDRHIHPRQARTEQDLREVATPRPHLGPIGMDQGRVGTRLNPDDFQANGLKASPFNLNGPNYKK